jgi:membrane-bound lytic murein transglycosylase B
MSIMRWLIGILIAAALASIGHLAWSQAQAPAPFVAEPSGDAEFDAWRVDFAARAIAAGRDPRVVQQLLGDLTPEPRVVQNDRNQAEFVRPVWDYIDRAVSADRIARGRQVRAQDAAVFSAVEARYGVDPDIVAGIWAIETNFGDAPLPHNAAQAIATLAAEGRRRPQFEGYLMALIQMVERGYAGPAEMRSSWAGALGQPQFMPDIYLRDAVDWNGDGKRNIWTDDGDVIASISNYLAVRGWSPGDPVFEEVRLPNGFDYALADGSMRPTTDWQALGVTRRDGSLWTGATAALSAQIFLPAGADGPALALFPNFAVIRSYNPSDRYALAVALLARGFEGREGIQASWPRAQGSLQRGDYIELQTLLAQKGFAVGAIDGMFGSNTRRAVRSYQQAEGLPADGWATRALLDRLRGRPAAPTGPTLADRQASSPALTRARDITTLQTTLNRLGYKIGKPNGKAGPKTRAAISAFERSLGLEPSGRASRFVLEQAQAAIKNRSRR